MAPLYLNEHNNGFVELSSSTFISVLIKATAQLKPIQFLLQTLDYFIELKCKEV